MSLDYKKSGVDVEAGDALVDWLQAENAQPTFHKERLISGIGGFAALFRGDFKEMKSPVLVSCTDGVGTKVKLASEFGRYHEVAQDMVAMCVNDMVCSGASPLFFLDYYACGKLDLEAAKLFLAGVKKACAESECVLIGGETAEMPGVYQNKDFDCAGFSVGVVDEEKILGPHRVKDGDVLLGVSSSGFHSNGYSLLRKVFEKDIKDWVDYLLTPTHLYVKLVKKILQEVSPHAIAHVTGGGFDNLIRVTPENSVLELKPWTLPKAFLEVKSRAQMSWESLLKTLNCGIGLGIYISPQDKDKATKIIQTMGFQAFDLGTVHVAKNQKEKAWVLDYKLLKE